MKARLKTHASCFSCGGTLTIWTGMRSPSPLSMRCPHCRQKLAIRFRGRALFICAVIAILIPCLFFLIWGWRQLPTTALLTRLAILFVGWILLELATAVFYFSFATLVPRAHANA
jgi:hypothetical protein